MEELLRPWFTAVDRLLPFAAVSPHGDGTQAPHWRVELSGGDPIGRSRELPNRVHIHLDAALPSQEQRQLREAFEVFALALRVDSCAFLDAVIDGVPWRDTTWNYAPFADDDALKIQVVGDLAVQESTFYDGFCADLTDANSSQEYKATKQMLLDFGGRPAPIEPTIELLVQLNCKPGPHAPTKLIEMLSRITRHVFRVFKMLVVLSPDVDPAPVPELLNMVHGFRDTAEIEVFVNLPVVANDHTELSRWKWLFDVVARTVYRCQNSTKPWNVTATFGDLGMDHRAGSARSSTAVACLSAIAHATDHVTTASLCMPLQDRDDERHVRAKYLGFLLRTRGVENLIISDDHLTSNDVTHMMEIYSKATLEDCLLALYEPTWHGQKSRFLDDKSAAKYATDTTEVLGVMHTSEGDIVDVYLAGYGQCGIKRSFLLEPLATVQPLPPSRLKSLEMTFLSGATTVPSMMQLVALVGHALHRLRLDCAHSAFTLSMLHTILDACPTLQKLTIKRLNIRAQDDDTVFPTPAPRQPLQALSVKLTTASFGESRGLAVLGRFLGTYTSDLKEFEFSAPERISTDHSIIPVFDELFTARMRLLKKVRVVGFTSGFLRGLWNRDRPSSIEVLLLETVTWDALDWSAFCAALSGPTHPLTLSVHTLHLRLTGWEDMALLPTMLEQNPFLFDVAIDCGIGIDIADCAAYKQQCLATNGRSVYHIKQKLSARHKAAFLSAMAATNRSIEVHNSSRSWTMRF